MRPPLHLVGLVQVDVNNFAGLAVGSGFAGGGERGQRPGGFVDVNGVREVALGESAHGEGERGSDMEALDRRALWKECSVGG